MSRKNRQTESQKSENTAPAADAASQQTETQNTVVAEVAPAPKPARLEANGVKQPKAGGLCRAVWDYCAGVKEATGVLPTVKEVKAHAQAVGWNLNNASIEYYAYRKFAGIRGRVQAPPAAPATDAATSV
jgi:hypothetical protein